MNFLKNSTIIADTDHNYYDLYLLCVDGVCALLLVW